MNRTGQLIASAALGPGIGTSHAQTSDETRQSALYLQSVELPKKAGVCAIEIPGFAERFRTEFPSWMRRNSVDIASGESFLKAEAPKADKSLRIASSTMIAENCAAILEQLGVPAK